jgi:hypothetical protein
VYCLLLRRRPVYLLDNGLNEIPVQRYATPANRKDRHHVFPRQVCSGLGIPYKLYNSVVNACLLVAEENQRIGARRPARYFKKIQELRQFKWKMRRHLIPADKASGIWVRSVRRGLRLFLEQRTRLICEALESEAGIRLFRR